MHCFAVQKIIINFKFVQNEKNSPSFTDIITVDFG